jgi:hypothetical protein
MHFEIIINYKVHFKFPVQYFIINDKTEHAHFFTTQHHHYFE